MDEQAFLMLAQLCSEISRPKESIEYLKQALKISPNLNGKQRSIFVEVYKDAIDPIRNTIRNLAEEEEIQKLDQKPEIYEKISQIKNEAISQLTDLCKDGVDLAENLVLPNISPEDHDGQVYFQKFIADLHRYSGESNEEPLRNSEFELAQKFYDQAISLSKEHLLLSDPVRLGTILNYAVFQYEHLHLYEEAAILLLNTMKALKDDDVGPFDNEAVSEADNIINIMQANLYRWGGISSSSDNEEEEH